MSDSSGGSNPVLPFTGERFTPECQREIWYEHWHRYVFARRFAAGKRVLDAACGEGYGSALLAQYAQSVIGVDIADSAVEHARQRYGHCANLRFERGDCTVLEFEDRAFDLVLSFETLEHLSAQEALIAGFARVLREDGMLIVSSPDKRVYSEKSGFRNEFHVRELYRDELLALLRKHFPYVQLYAQKLLFQSALWGLDGQSGPADLATYENGSARTGLGYEPLYYLAVCSKQPLQPGFLPQIALFGDSEESVYAHYNHEVRKNMAAGARIAELEQQLRTLQAATANADPGAGLRQTAATPKPRRWWFGKTR